MFGCFLFYLSSLYRTALCKTYPQNFGFLGKNNHQYTQEVYDKTIRFGLIYSYEINKKRPLNISDLDSIY
jgi:hypothetical protein